MNDKDKKEVMAKFKAKNERDIIRNNGIPIAIGDTTIQLKELLWDDAEDFEDKVIELSGMFNDLEGMKFKDLDPRLLVETLVTKLLRQGLLDLAEILTDGEVTRQFIIDHKARKSDVIVLVTEGFILNYGFVKNLMTLVTGMR